LEAVERMVGLAVAAELMGLSRAAMARIRERVARHAIPCDLAEGVVVASWFDAAAELRAGAEGFNRRFGAALEFWPRERLRALYPSPHYWDGIFDPEGFHLDPLALARGYAAAAVGLGVRVHEGSPALAVERRPGGGGWRVRTPGGAVLAERVVLCQSAYPPPVLPGIARSTLPVFTYVIVTEPLEGGHAGVIRAPHAVYDTRFATGYYRLLPGGRLLWGGRISVRERRRDLQGLMRRDLAYVYPQLAGVRVEHAWSGRMGFTRHRMPLVRELEPGLWVNTGFGGHGLNTTTMGGELVAAALAEGDDRWRLLEPFALRWVGGALGRLAAQALYWGHTGHEAARAAWQRRRDARPTAGG
jgi:gamma-glutamylputrescine oxidase